MFKRAALVLLAMLASIAAAAAQQGGNRARGDLARPRLAVVIAIDQFRADFLTRFADLYLPPGRDETAGGFRYLQSRGAWYPDCRFDHHRTVTGAGHAVIGTGAQPYVHGIVGNTWWDRAGGKQMYCVADPKSSVVGLTRPSRETPMSPANLLTTTFGDELELATGGRSRTVSLSMKDRATILMIGHRADTAIWFAEDAGEWISSSFYCKDGKLPEWVSRLNARRLPDESRRTPWTPSVDSAAMQRVWNPKGASLEFSRPLTGTTYDPWITSPAANAFVFDTAREAVAAEELGRDEIPDVLTLNLASNDYVGHRYGPDSPEVLDISVQTDRQLSAFLRFLHRAVPGGLANVTIALTADHGVANVPELNAASGVPASRAVVPHIRAAVERALDEQVGPADWIASTDNGEIYFAAAALAQYPRESRSRLEEIAADAVRAVPGVLTAVGKSSVLSGRLPVHRLGRMIGKGVHPERSGDLIVILNPQWLPGSAPTGTGTSHGAPFPYDSHVPLLMAGFGVRPGTYLAPVSPAWLAPSLSHILGVARPSGADTPLLPGLAH
jgi:predicted AlkP superfamily pyrophosphatase or phosphodiesterase